VINKSANKHFLFLPLYDKIKKGDEKNGFI